MIFKKYSNEFDRVYKQYNLFMKLTTLDHNKLIESSLDLNGSEKVLDIGGGTGLTAKHIANKVKEFVLIDKSDKMIKQNKLDIRTITGDFLEYNFENELFDIIILSDVVHHIKEQKKLFKKVYSLLKNSGIVLVHDFNINSKRVKLLEQFEKKLFGEVFFKTDLEMENLLVDNNFVIKEKKDKKFWYILTGNKKGKI